MAGSITVDKKRGRGRPATGRDPAVSLRLPTQTLEKIDAMRGDRTRSDVIREIVVKALD